MVSGFRASPIYDSRALRMERHAVYPIETGGQKAGSNEKWITRVEDLHCISLDVVVTQLHGSTTEMI